MKRFIEVTTSEGEKRCIETSGIYFYPCNEGGPGTYTKIGSMHLEHYGFYVKETYDEIKFLISQSEN